MPKLDEKLLRRRILYDLWGSKAGNPISAPRRGINIHPCNPLAYGYRFRAGHNETGSCPCVRKHLIPPMWLPRSVRGCSFHFSKLSSNEGPTRPFRTPSKHYSAYKTKSMGTWPETITPCIIQNMMSLKKKDLLNRESG